MTPGVSKILIVLYHMRGFATRLHLRVSYRHNYGVAPRSLSRAIRDGHVSTKRSKNGTLYYYISSTEGTWRKTSEQTLERLEMRLKLDEAIVKNPPKNNLRSE